MSPPFNFAVTTKIPHLPFEDRSIQFIYCGSLFTHLDDLADSWLLELRRVLSPEGRLYLTASDANSISVIAKKYRHYGYFNWLEAQGLFERARSGFQVCAIGRDTESHVFYGSEFIRSKLSRIFEIDSINEEAYFFQTGFLLKRI